MKLKDYPAYKENPFIEPMIDVIKEKYKTVTISKSNGDSAMIASNGDNYESTIVTHIRKRVDSEAFVKLFKGQLTSVFELSRTAQKLLQYILEEIEPNKDYIKLLPNEAMNRISYKSSSSLYIGLEEIIAKNILSRSTIQNKYFINPAIIFNGNRLRIIQDYQIKPGIEASGKRTPIINPDNEDWD